MTLHRLIRYFGRKPRVSEWIKLYSKPKDVILDPFGGAGTIVLEAVKLGRRAIYFDLNPYIVLMIKGLIKSLTLSNEMKISLIKLGKFLIEARKRIPVIKIDNERHSWIPSNQLYKINSKVVKYVLWQNYKPLKARTIDGNYIDVPESWQNFPYEPYHSYPKVKIWYGKKPFYTRRNVDYIHEFFTKRNLVALSTLIYDIKHRFRGSRLVRKLFEIAFLMSLYKSSKMARLSGGSWPVPKYWIPERHVEFNVYSVFLNNLRRIKHFLDKCEFLRVKIATINSVLQRRAHLSISQGDACQLPLPDQCIDYVITDPPMLDEVQYLELSYFYLAWLKINPPFDKEIVVNPMRGVDERTYFSMLGKALGEIHRVLKDGKIFTLIVHDEPTIVDNIISQAENIGFRLIRSETVRRFRALNSRLGDEYEAYLTFKKVS